MSLTLLLMNEFKIFLVASFPALSPSRHRKILPLTSEYFDQKFVKIYNGIKSDKRSVIFLISTKSCVRCHIGHSFKNNHLVFHQLFLKYYFYQPSTSLMSFSNFKPTRYILDSDSKKIFTCNFVMNLFGVIYPSALIYRDFQNRISIFRYWYW